MLKINIPFQGPALMCGGNRRERRESRREAEGEGGKREREGEKERNRGTYVRFGRK